MLSLDDVTTAQEPVYYKLSGKIPLPVFLLGVLSILLLVPLIGLIYGAAIHYCPLIYINFVSTLICGFGIGALVGLLLKKGKLRNLKFGSVLLLVAGFVGVYACWVSKIFLLTGYEVVVLLPNQILAMLGWMAEEGVWSIGSMTPTGLLLYVVWVIEAGAIIVIAFLTGRGILDEIFCEYCDRWVGREEIECRSLDFDGSSELEDFVEQVKRGGVLKLNELPPRPEGSDTFSSARDVWLQYL